MYNYLTILFEISLDIYFHKLSYCERFMIIEIRKRKYIEDQLKTIEPNLKQMII